MGIKITCDGCGKENDRIKQVSDHALVEFTGCHVVFFMLSRGSKPWASMCVSPGEHDDSEPCEIVIACSPKCSEEIDRKRSEKARAHLSIVPPVKP